MHEPFHPSLSLKEIFLIKTHIVEDFHQGIPGFNYLKPWMWACIFVPLHLATTESSQRFQTVVDMIRLVKEVCLVKF